MERIYGLDALRAITMYLGVILHSAIAYKAGHHPRYWVNDPSFKNYFFDELYLWIHSFRMPLFFLLSGFFTVLLINKIGRTEFFKNRLKRILIPFLVCLVLILPFSIAPFTFSRLYFDEGYSFLHAMNEVWKDMLKMATFQKFNGVQHFWFLLNLLYFYSAYLIVTAAGIDPGKIANRLPKKIGSLTLVAVLITFCLMVLYLDDATPEIWTGFVPKSPQLLYYGFYYLIGVFLFHNKNLFESIKRYTWLFIITGTLLNFINVYLFNNVIIGGTLNSAMLLFKMLLAIQNVVLCFGLLGLCLSLFRQESPFVRYLSDASYWVYIIHFGLVVWFQIFGIILDIPPLLRFPLTLIGTSLVAYVTYALLIRYTIAGKYLHGTRRRQAKGVNVMA